MKETKLVYPIKMKDPETAESKDIDQSADSDDEEIELTAEQEERIDQIYNAVYDMCQVMTENTDLEYDASYIGEIADIAASILCNHNYKVRFPAIVYDEDKEGNMIGSHIEEYYGDDAITIVAKKVNF